MTDFDAETHKMKSFMNMYSKIYSRESGIKAYDDEWRGDETRELVIDPFARNCLLAHPHTNDINPETLAVHHLDALEFLNGYSHGSFTIGLLDPPFSDRMSKDKYGTSNLYASDSKKMRAIEFQLGNLIEHHGIIIKLGYNSSKPHPGFVLEDFEIWNLGACRNDIIVSIWRKVDMSLEKWI